MSPSWSLSLSLSLLPRCSLFPSLILYQSSKDKEDPSQHIQASSQAWVQAHGVMPGSCWNFERNFRPRYGPKPKFFSKPMLRLHRNPIGPSPTPGLSKCDTDIWMNSSKTSNGNEVGSKRHNVPSNKCASCKSSCHSYESNIQ